MQDGSEKYFTRSRCVWKRNVTINSDILFRMIPFESTLTRWSPKGIANGPKLWYGQRVNTAMLEFHTAALLGIKLPLHSLVEFTWSASCNIPSLFVFQFLFDKEKYFFQFIWLDWYRKTARPPSIYLNFMYLYTSVNLTRYALSYQWTWFYARVYALMTLLLHWLEH